MMVLTEKTESMVPYPGWKPCRNPETPHSKTSNPRVDYPLKDLHGVRHDLYSAITTALLNSTLKMITTS
jgi:hypothetical protein